MSKISAWLITFIGVLLALPLLGVAVSATTNSWLIALAVLAIGVTKLLRSYKLAKI